MAKIANVTVSRAFDHKVHGRIGIVELVAEVGSVTLNGKELPATSVEYLLTFALQNLQDAYAGADSAADAVGRFEKKLDRLLAGSIGVRDGGAGASAETKMIRVIMGELLRTSDAGKAALKAHEDDRDEFLDAVFAKQAEAKQALIRTGAAERLELARQKAEYAKSLASGIDL